MLYSSKHIALVNAYKRTFAIIQTNTKLNLPPSLRALDDHQCALLRLRQYLDASDVRMPQLK